MFGKKPQILQTLFLLLLAAGIPCCIASCESSRELTIVNQEAAIDSYINSKYKDNQVVRNNGSNRIIILPGDSTQVAMPGDSAVVSLRGYVFNNGPLTQFIETDVVTCIGDGSLISGLDSGIQGMNLGEQAHIIFTAKMGFYSELVGIVPKMSPLFYIVTLASIKKNS